MEVILIAFFAFAAYCILYYIVKAAVRDGIVEARQIKDEEDSSDGGIQQTICTNCGKRYDIDYPKCPNCGRKPL